MSNTKSYPESQSEVIFRPVCPFLQISSSFVFFLAASGFEGEIVTADSTDVTERPQRNSMSTARWITQRQIV